MLNGIDRGGVREVRRGGGVVFAKAPAIARADMHSPSRRVEAQKLMDARGNDSNIGQLA